MKNIILLLLTIAIGSFWIAYLDLYLTGGDYFDDLRWWGWIAAIICLGSFAFLFFVLPLLPALRKITEKLKK